jgi:hypothetical protein
VNLRCEIVTPSLQRGRWLVLCVLVVIACTVAVVVHYGPKTHSRLDPILSKGDYEETKSKTSNGNHIPRRQYRSSRVR